MIFGELRRTWLPVAIALTACGSRGADAPMPNWGYVEIDNTTYQASAGFYRGIGLIPAAAPITQTDECVAYHVASTKTSDVAIVGAGTVKIAGRSTATLGPTDYKWQGTTALSLPGDAVSVAVQGSADVPPVVDGFVTPYSIRVTAPTFADGLAIDTAKPLELAWTPSECTIGFVLENNDVSLKCSWPAASQAATIPPQLLTLFASSTPAPAKLSVDCASWQHPTASDWAFTMSLHMFYQQIAITTQ